MARIVGVEIPDQKKIKIALTYIYGVGRKTALDLLHVAKVDSEKRAKELSPEEVTKLIEVIDKNVVTEGTLRQQIFQNIKRLKDIKAYRGLRHKAGLPVRGQNTKKNARTRKGKGVAIAMKKKETK